MAYAAPELHEPFEKHINGLDHVAPRFEEAIAQVRIASTRATKHSGRMNFSNSDANRRQGKQKQCNRLQPQMLQLLPLYKLETPLHQWLL